MSRRYKYFLWRYRDTYVLTRGNIFEKDSTLAIVRADKIPNSLEQDFKGEWILLDIASGIQVLNAKSKPKLFEKLEQSTRWSSFRELQFAIEEARRSKRIKDLTSQCLAEKVIWRNAGYDIL